LLVVTASRYYCSFGRNEDAFHGVTLPYGFSHQVDKTCHRSCTCEVRREYFTHDIAESIGIPDVLNQATILEDAQLTFEIGVVLLKVNSVPFLR